MMKLRSSFPLFLCIGVLFFSTACSTPRMENTLNSVISSANSEFSSEFIDRMKQQKPFVQIDMIMISSGYAMTKDFHVLKTIDSGVNWDDLLTANSLFSHSDEPVLYGLNTKQFMLPPIQLLELKLKNLRILAKAGRNPQ